MTTDEIRALVAQKIAGQGSAVDVGGGLPTILNAICDALDAIPAPVEVPDWVADVPIIESVGAEIDETEFIKLTSYGAVVYMGGIYVSCSNEDIIGRALSSLSVPTDYGALYVSTVFSDDSPSISGVEGILFYATPAPDSKYLVQEYSV